MSQACRGLKVCVGVRRLVQGFVFLVLCSVVVYVIAPVYDVYGCSNVDCTSVCSLQVCRQPLCGQ